MENAPQNKRKKKDKAYHPAEHARDVNSRTVFRALLIKENFSVEETKAIVEEIGGNGMGILFENMEKMDIQAERRNTQRERERAEVAEQRADTAERKVEVEKRRADIAEQEILRLRQELAKYQRN